MNKTQEILHSLEKLIKWRRRQSRCNHSKSIREGSGLCEECGFLRLPVVTTYPSRCKKCEQQLSKVDARGIYCPVCNSYENWFCAPELLVEKHRESIKDFVARCLDNYPEQEDFAKRMGWANCSDRQLVWLASFLNEQTIVESILTSHNNEITSPIPRKKIS